MHDQRMSVNDFLRIIFGEGVLLSVPALSWSRQKRQV
jgi:hypothetical protein